MWSPVKDYLFLVHRNLENNARRHLQQLRGRVLDLGCGDAPYRDLLPPDAVHIGVDRLQLPGVRARAAIEALPFASGSFDAALCTEVLEYSPRPWQVLAELARVVRPGGRLYLTAPFDWHLMQPHDFFRFTPDSLRSLLDDARFDVDTIEPVGGLFSSSTGKLLENLFCDVWVPLLRSVGVKRGAYRSAALFTLPLNLAAVRLAPALDRLTPRSPTSIAVTAVRRA